MSPALLEASINHPEQAIKLVNVFSRSTLAPPPSVLGPGTWVYGASIALARRVLDALDQMTPPKAAQSLITAARAREKSAQVIQLPVGHNQMTEAPEPLLAALTGFLTTRPVAYQ